MDAVRAAAAAACQTASWSRTTKPTATIAMSSATTKGKTSANSTVDWPRSYGLANGVGAADDVANDGVEEFADAASTAAFGCPCHNEQGNDAGAK